MNHISVSGAPPVGRRKQRLSTVRTLSLLVGAILASAVAGPGHGAWAAESPDPGPSWSPAISSANVDTIEPLSAGRGYVDGDGGATGDDWRDEGTVRPNGSYWHSNVAGFWQMVLWADGLLPSSEVDCQFGPITSAATTTWQQRYLAGAPASGAADPATWGRADDFIRPDPLGPEYFRYIGTGGRFVQLHRYGPGVSNPNRYDVNFFGEWRGSWYNSVTVSFC